MGRIALIIWMVCNASFFAKQLIIFHVLAHQYFGMTTFYPSIRFTFGLPELAPDDEVVVFSIRIKQNVSCRLIIEDKQK